MIYMFYENFSISKYLEENGCKHTKQCIFLYDGNYMCYDDTSGT